MQMDITTYWHKPIVQENLPLHLRNLPGSMEKETERVTERLDRLSEIADLARSLGEEIQELEVVVTEYRNRYGEMDREPDGAPYTDQAQQDQQAQQAQQEAQQNNPSDTAREMLTENISRSAPSGRRDSLLEIPREEEASSNFNMEKWLAQELENKVEYSPSMKAVLDKHFNDRLR